MIFNDVELLGYNHENTFFGEQSLQYSSKKIFSIRGYILDLSNSNGSEGVFTKLQQLIESTKEFQNVTINGENFGRGKVTSFSVNADNWVKYTQYEATVEIYESCPLSNLNSPEFNSINLNDKNFYLLKDFSENFSVSFDTQNKVLDGEHSINIQYDALNTNTPLLVYAQALAKELLKTLPTSVSSGNYSVRGNFKVLNSENYNLVDGRCGFKRTFSYNNENTGLNYSVKRNVSLNVDAEGIARATETCEIKGEYDVPSLYDNANSGLQQEISGAKGRCDAVLSAYQTKFNISRPLNDAIIEKNIKINKFEGVINYSISFDNDITRDKDKYTFESIQTLERNDKGIWTASESGDITGNEPVDSKFSKYTSAEQGWSEVKPGIAGRINSFYTTYAKEKSSDPVLKLLRYNIDRSKYQGKISYDYAYTDDPELEFNNVDGITKINIEQSDTGLQPITKAFIIPNSATKYPVLQNRDLKRQGTYTIKVNFEVGCLTEEFDSKAFYEKALEYISFDSRSDLPLGANGGGSINTVLASDPKDPYLSSLNYTCNEIDRTAELTAEYIYS
jgi:hypothetical protein